MGRRRGRRYDPLRVAEASLEGARARLADLERRSDLSDDERGAMRLETLQRIAELEAQIADLT